VRHLPSLSRFSFFTQPITLVGILNVTPDSFSDGGKWIAVEQAVQQGFRLAADGAHLVDVGGESTRPGASPVTVLEELKRVVPVIEALAAAGVATSVDTRRAEVAAAAIAAGAVVINDVGGLRDPEMASTIGDAGVPVIIMHTPLEDVAASHRFTDYSDVVRDVRSFLQEQVELGKRNGVVEMAIDPGLGFGKTTAHNLLLLKELRALSIDGCPLLIGASRKRFVGELSGVVEASERDLATIAVHLRAIDNGATALRVHDVAGHAQAIKVWQGLSD
jgi:dihydropteroate synthase